MRKTIKRIVEVILTTTAGIALLLACAENPDGSVNIIWSLGCLAVTIICAKTLERTGAFKREERR